MASQTETVAGNIRALMARHRIPQTAFAAALGITQQSVSNRVNGRVPIDVNELYVFAHILGVEPADLLADPTANVREAS